MLLFIDRLPFHTWTDHTKTPPKTYWSIIVPILVTERSASAPPVGASVQDWVLDSANTGEAFAWRVHLLAAGLDPDIEQEGVKITITSALGSKMQVPIRRATLWLISNLPAFQAAPFRIDLNQGIPFRDVPTVPDPYFNRPILGIRAMRRAGLRVELDFANDTLSVWIPDPQYYPLVVGHT